MTKETRHEIFIPNKFAANLCFILFFVNEIFLFNSVQIAIITKKDGKWGQMQEYKLLDEEQEPIMKEDQEEDVEETSHTSKIQSNNNYPPQYQDGNWSKYLDNESQCYFYYNHISGESQWEE